MAGETLILKVSSRELMPLEGYYDPENVVDARLALQDLCRVLSPIFEEPVLRSWKRADGEVVLEEIALRPRDGHATWTWQATGTTESLTTEISGLAFRARRDGTGHWTMFLDGRALTRSEPAKTGSSEDEASVRWRCPKSGRSIGRSLEVGVRYDKLARIRRTADRCVIELSGICLSDGSILPADAALEGRFEDEHRAIDFGPGQPVEGDPRRWRWSLVMADPSLALGRLSVQTRLKVAVDADPASWVVEAVAQTDFRAGQVVGGELSLPDAPSAVVQIKPGVAQRRCLELLRFETDDPEAAPSQIRLAFRPLSETDAPAPPAGEATHSAVLERTEDDGVCYRLQPGFGLPSARELPLRLEIYTPGQDGRAGLLYVMPAWIRGCWKRAPDSLRRAPGNPVLDSRFVDLEGRFEGWRASSPYTIQQQIGEISLDVEFRDDDFTPLLQTGLTSGKPLWNGATVNAEVGTEVVAWVPGRLPVACGVGMDRRLPVHHENLKELAFIEARDTRRPLRLEGKRRGPNGVERYLGVVWPSVLDELGDGWRDPTKWEPVSASHGRFSLGDVSGRAFLVWFRGLWLPAKLIQEASQWMLQLDEALPCDGRLGLDVGPFLPLRSTRLDPDNIVLRSDDWSAQVHRRAGVWSAGQAQDRLLYYWKNRGFKPHRPRARLDTRRYAWRDLIWIDTGAHIDFGGWLLTDADGFFHPSAAPFHGYGFRAGDVSLDWLQVHAPEVSDPVFAQLPMAVRAVVQTMFDIDGPDDEMVVSDEGVFQLARSYDDPDEPPFVEVNPPRPAPMLQVQLFTHA